MEPMPSQLDLLHQTSKIVSSGLSLDEMLERYRIEGPIDEAADRAAWQEIAAADVLGARDD